ncbi:MAG: alcohol dehydrogenase catalytic domain-containing protein [Candidatus Rokubacteria bacterium]|nr:alcohol dehydrogenase catalytic domain-containing protein [Candidatus Rokubacteria bacterium]
MGRAGAMKAMVLPALGAPLRLETVPVPTIGPNDVLLRVRATGVGLTVVIMTAVPGRVTSFPRIPGHEVAGEIAEVGGEVAHVKVGDRVTCHFYLSERPRRGDRRRRDLHALPCLPRGGARGAGRHRPDRRRRRRGRHPRRADGQALRRLGGGGRRHRRQAPGGEGLRRRCSRGFPERRPRRAGGRLVIIGSRPKAVFGVEAHFTVDPGRMLYDMLEIHGSRYVSLAELQQTLELLRQKRVRAIVSRTFPLEGAEEAHELLRKNALVGRAALLQGG